MSKTSMGPLVLHYPQFGSVEFKRSQAQLSLTSLLCVCVCVCVHVHVRVCV